MVPMERVEIRAALIAHWILHSLSFFAVLFHCFIPFWLVLIVMF